MNTKLKKVLNEIHEEYPNLMRGWGMPRLKNEKKLTVAYSKGGNSQFLYGDVIDWLKDNRDIYKLSLEEEHELATILIGEFVIKNRLL